MSTKSHTDETETKATRKMQSTARLCAFCGHEFMGRRRARYCCNAHRQAAYRKRLATSSKEKHAHTF